MFNLMGNDASQSEKPTGIQRDVESEFGQRLRALRESLARSQEAVAARMREAGHDWHQTTLSKVEAGQRGVSLNEAHSLARILGSHLRDFLDEGPSELQAEWERAMARFFEASEALDAMQKRYDAAERHLNALAVKVEKAQPKSKSKGKR